MESFHKLGRFVTLEYINYMKKIYPNNSLDDILSRDRLVEIMGRAKDQNLTIAREVFSAINRSHERVSINNLHRSLDQAIDIAIQNAVTIEMKNKD